MDTWAGLAVWNMDWTGSGGGANAGDANAGDEGCGDDASIGSSAPKDTYIGDINYYLVLGKRETM